MVHSEEELKMLVTASQEAGVLEEQEEQMLHRVFGFADLTAGQVMMPRTELVAVAAETPLRRAARDRSAQAGHTRLPVYRDDLDDVVGMLHVDRCRQGARAPACDDQRRRARARGADGAGDAAAPTICSAEMRRRRVREALVIDEYGGTAGLVTFESLMERIVGEIRRRVGARPRIVVRADGSADIDGLALVTDVNEQFGLHIDEDTYTTIGGYVLGRLGRRRASATPSTSKDARCASKRSTACASRKCGCRQAAAHPSPPPNRQM